MTDSILKTVQELIDSDEVHFINVENKFRFERKFTVPTVYSMKQIEQYIKRNSYLFREVYHERQVNNIYFDSPAYNDYFDNVLGVSDRKKIRIRWYGDTFQDIQNPVLEVKVKRGLVGDKWSYKLKPFSLDNSTTRQTFLDVFRVSDLPLPILESVKTVYPTLLNSYIRKYYLSANKAFRVTLDYGLIYHRIESHRNNFSRKPIHDENKIVELKYSLENDKYANAITTQFPFRLNKNSKYVNGINSLKRFPQ